ncbi:Oidioi.mRNA.OKI2018_I69.PAR.g11517.t1.cds [Oikopleura dioica]|uniref:Oidioi.mRNA.OKI2018_I69.PAR.g11517.t1.cds n=1 Tax=Oikopleura dioica TaxID=34765 RepID=A0ABN7RZD1_OIKDI|nr:Oidioi.mRNA.OKI2018_I69.PAR.g11517.t1.cds [Oikopleura dioica]
MKTRFTVLDIKAALAEIRANLLHHYVLNIYDIDAKTYLLKLRKCASKHVLLFESGTRVHPTEMEWPKNTAPSGFSMKLRKHLKGKRLINASQLGFDRIIDLQFGTSACLDEYHLIIELYDRGNIILCDQDYTILNLLRARTDKATDERFAVRETYPVAQAQPLKEPYLSVEELQENVKPSQVQGNKKKNKNFTIAKQLNSSLGYGTDVIEHFLIEQGLDVATASVVQDPDEILECLQSCYDFLNSNKTNFQGYISTKTADNVLQYVDYQPFLFHQSQSDSTIELERFSLAVDKFYGEIQSQKAEQKMVQAEKAAMKKLENVKLDHMKRLESLKLAQADNVRKAQLIEMNLELVDSALNQVRSALASQIGWEEIEEFLEEGQDEGDPVSIAIRELKLKTNQIVMMLSEPDYDDSDSSSEDEDAFYDSKRAAADKESKTIDASKKALKSAEKKTNESLKNIQTVRQVTKVRKQMWFEKFFWFISSENYLVIAGKDAQQNETIVKKYLKNGDVYVHADIHGASSCIVKNIDPSKPVSPVTLHEVGHAAVCHSAAWNAKCPKRRRRGEYLTTGSFMIRGKKNYLPPSQLVLGFGFLFKLDDASVARHAGERRIKGQANEVEEDDISDLVEIKEENETEPKLEGESDGESDGSDEKSEALQFPDTKIDIKYNVEEEVEEIVNVGKGAGKREKTKEEKKGRAKPAWQLEHEQQRAEKDKFRKKRGKAGKEKKMKQKYGDQDEEDRAAMMEFLGSAGAKKQSKKFQRAEKRELKKGGGARGQKKGPKEKKANTFERANEELPPPEVLPEDPDCKAEMVIEQMKEDADEEEITKMLEEEGFVDDDDISMLDQLTGKPTEEDLVHYAVPVVAPLSSLRDYKYHIKFVPGTGKKGKSAKQAVSIFCGKKEARQVEIDLMRAVKDEDMTHNMPGKLKLAGQQVQMYKKKH